MKKFFKKKSNIVSLVFLVIGVVMMLTLLIIPHGGKYVNKGETPLKNDYTLTYTFKGDKVEISYDVGNSRYTSEASYEIKDGKLLIGSDSLINVSEYLTRIGFGDGVKINAFKMVSGTGENAAVAKCTLNYVLLYAGAGLAVIGLVGTLAGILKLNKKKK